MKQTVPLVVLAGPTASGKTRLGIDLAKRFDGEVISADSMQIYRGMAVGTAQPTQEEMQGVPHHLIGFLQPGQEFSVAQYVELAREKIAEISARGRLPLVVGGTGLYISSLVDHVQFAPTGSSAAIREKYQRMAQQQGNQAVLDCLSRVDPEAAKKLHSNNLGRVIRALELYELTGKTMAEHLEQSRREPSPYRLCYLGLDYRDRQNLYNRINLRADLMLEQGLLEEARELFSGSFSATAAQAIGYKELLPWYRGEDTLEHCMELVKQQSRRYAKRQLTWFRRDSRVQWLFPDQEESYAALLEKACRCVENSPAMCYTNL